MNENQPIEDLHESLGDAEKLRAMIAMPGWTDVVLPHLTSARDAYKQQLLDTEWPSLDEMNRVKYRYNAINELLFMITGAIEEATQLEIEAAVKEGDKKK